MLCLLFGFALATESLKAAEKGSAIGVDWSGITERGNQLDTTLDGDVISVTTRGNDPYFFFRLPSLPAGERDWLLEWEYFCPEGIGGLEWRSGRNIANPVATSLPALKPAEGWTSYAVNLNDIAPGIISEKPTERETVVRIDLGRRPGIRLQVRNISLRPMNDREYDLAVRAVEIREGKEDLARRIRKYQSTVWPASIDSAILDGDHVRIAGRVDENRSRTAFVVVRYPESPAAAVPSTEEFAHRWPIESTTSGEGFQTKIPAAALSSWLYKGLRFQVFFESEHGPVPGSPAVYLEPSCRESVAPPPPLRAAKGLTCITPRFSPVTLRELGIKHASVNMVLTGLVSQSARPGWVRVDLDGESWWVNEPRLRQQDRDIRTARDAGCVVAAILLIPTRNQDRPVIAHPESTTAGTYAMPDLTDREATRHYASTLHLLAERYSGIDEEHGRVDHWIVHNEVDYGWQWTNMGEQPFEVFMDHYVRSMRMVDVAVRRYNEHSHVFISLTHRWNTTDNHHWRTYPPKSMLEWLINNSRLEGDFPWGIAYHPYPQSLWKADFWNDRRVADDFETPLITLKNLPVLERFVQRAESRMASGEVRPVICSEQGFHAAEDNPEQLRIQAAALLRTWEVLRECPSVLAFDYHRPSDHPREGGLRLGLRGLPNSTNRLGAEKPAWKIFAAIGTEREKELVERYRNVWESESDPEDVK